MIIYIAKEKKSANSVVKALKRHEEFYGKKLILNKSSTGKPFLNTGYISISHSGDYTVIAIADSEVGIDIEKIREIDYKRIAKRFFRDEAIDNLNDFFDIWVRTESYLKYTGAGLKDLSKIENISGTMNYDFINGYAMAICSEEQSRAFCFL